MLRKKLALLAVFNLLFAFSLTANAQSANALLRGNYPVAGNPKGNITVVEFFDYQCSHCASMAPVISAVIRSNPNVRFVFKDFPIRGPMSEYAARAALAANMQGKYYQLNHALLTTNEPLTKENVISIAKANGLNTKKLEKDMFSATVTNQLKGTYQLAQELKLTGTPAFFIGKTNSNSLSNVNYVLGEMSQSDLQTAIDQAKK